MVPLLKGSVVVHQVEDPVEVQGMVLVEVLGMVPGVVPRVDFVDEE